MKIKNIMVLLISISTLYAQDTEKVKNEGIFNKLINEMFTNANVTAESNYRNCLTAYNSENINIIIAGFKDTINTKQNIGDAQIKLMKCYEKSELIENAINQFNNISHLCSKDEEKSFNYLTDDDRKDCEGNLIINVQKFLNEELYLISFCNDKMGNSSTDIFGFTRHMFTTSLIYKY